PGQKRETQASVLLAIHQWRFVNLSSGPARLPPERTRHGVYQGPRTPSRVQTNIACEKQWSRMKETIMKIVVIGGTGLIGSKLVTKLREHGHEAVPASPDTGVNTLTGAGLTEVV